jgi:Zn-dependent peptidase ImmA (M78 family)
MALTRAEEKREQEANTFALCLLIPEESIRDDLRDADIDLCDENAWRALCRKYDVSSWMMAARISMLGYWRKRKI